jgi:predicted MPP superfamily phosphohydrolase
MNYLLWLVISCSIVALSCGYMGWRVINAADLSSPWKAVAWAALVFFAALIPVTFFLQINRMEFPGKEILSWTTYLSMAFFWVLLTVLIVRDVGWLVVAALQKSAGLLAGIFGGGAGVSVPPDPERRRLLMRTMSLGVLAAAGSLTAYGFFEARRRPSLVRLDIPIPRLHPDMEGLTILQITDLHAGLTVGRSFVETVVEQANEQHADIIVFTGDLVDGSVPKLRDAVAPMAGLSARLGKFFITGNHEYYSGAVPWVEEARGLGFTVLLNEHAVIRQGGGSLLLAGVTDYSGGQFVPTHASDPAKAFQGAPPTDARILLAHQPRSLYAALPLGYDLQISGHTHGGQFFPYNFLAAVGQPYVSGLHRHENSWVYVSKGTGYWGPPIRIGARSEVTLFTLTKG